MPTFEAKALVFPHGEQTFKFVTSDRWAMVEQPEGSQWVVFRSTADSGQGNMQVRIKPAGHAFVGVMKHWETTEMQVTLDFAYRMLLE